jgi:hypothetical protein
MQVSQMLTSSPRLALSHSRARAVVKEKYGVVFRNVRPPWAPAPPLNCRASARPAGSSKIRLHDNLYSRKLCMSGHVAHSRCEPSTGPVRQLSKALRTKCGFGQWFIAVRTPRLLAQSPRITTQHHEGDHSSDGPLGIRGDAPRYDASRALAGCSGRVGRIAKALGIDRASAIGSSLTVRHIWARIPCDE